MSIADLFDVTEFSWIDADSMHLVKTPANGVDSPLLAKAAEAMDEAIESLVKQFTDGLCGVSGCGVCHERYSVLKETDGFVEKAKLKAKERKALPKSDFVFPKKAPDEGSYPIPDESHGRNALSHGKANASPEELAEIKRKVHAKFPDIAIDGEDTEKDTAPDKSIPRAEAESQTLDNVEGNEGGGADPGAALEAGAQGASGEPRGVSFPHGPHGDGQGETAPDKDLHEGEALSQTHDNIEGNAAKAEADGTGDKAPVDFGAAQQESESQTRGDVEGNATKETPGSPEWESHDVELGERAEALIGDLAEIVRTFTDREKAEGGEIAKEAALVVSRVKYLLENPALIEKGAEMGATATELLKAVDDHEAARRDQEKAEKSQKKVFDKAVLKAAKKMNKKKMLPKDGEGEGAEGAEKASKATEPAKLSKKDLRKEVDALQKTVADIAAQDGHRIPVSPLGVLAHLRGPDAGNVFKAFDDRVASAEDRVAKATDDFEKRRARTDLANAVKQRTLAKMVAQENGRENGRLPHGSSWGPNAVELFDLGKLHTLPDDPTLKGI